MSLPLNILACFQFVGDKPYTLKVLKPMPKFIDLTGKSFGRLIVVVLDPPNHYLCLCSCGVTTRVSANNLRSGNTTSCGCLQRERTSQSSFKHGHNRSNSKRSKEYSCWASMIKRCTNPKHKFWMRYGGRGIKVCDKWLNSFEEFLKDVGVAPSKFHTLDRIKGNYEPGNVRWATLKEQNNNTCQNRKIEFKGEIKNLVEWAEIYNISPVTLVSRLNRGWPVDVAIMKPVRQKIK
jgi:hypothetical protein